MAKYRKIDPKIWHDEKFRGLSRDAQFLFIYLLTSPHSTSWGCYVIDDLYIVADTGLTKPQLEKAVSELLANRLILRCERTRLVAFPNWFEYNTPVNAKSAAACINGIKSLPKSSIISEYCKRSIWLSEQLANGRLTVPEKVDGEQEQEQDIRTGYTPPISPPLKSQKKKFTLPDWIDPDIWADFKEMRQRIKKPMTHRAMELTISKLEKLSLDGNDPNEVLNQSIANSYQGVFPINGNNGGKKTTTNKKSDIMEMPDGSKVSRAGYNTAIAGFKVAQELFGEDSYDDDQD
jgi:hypothetical protein